MHDRVSEESACQQAEPARAPEPSGATPFSRILQQKIYRRALQRRAARAGGASEHQDASPEASIARAGQESGAPVDGAIQRKVEQATGADLGSVRVHTGTASAQAASSVEARAYTVGQDVHFGAGEYNPGTREGDRLIAHELVHTVQQGGSPCHQNKLEVSQPGDSAEVEADRIADSVVDGGGGGGGGGAQRVAESGAGVALKEKTRKERKAEKKTLKSLDHLLDKGDKMTAEEAEEARDLLFKLDGETFRKTLKKVVKSGDFFTMLSRLSLSEIWKTLKKISHNVVLPTTLLKPATNTIADDFKRANEIWNPHGVEVVQGDHMALSEKASKKILGKDLELDEFTSDEATKEELKLVKKNRDKGRITGYWVPSMPDSRGEMLSHLDLTNMKKNRTSVVVNTADRAQDTFAHELGHALGLPHDCCQLDGSGDPDNLMTAGDDGRNITGPGIDKLTDEQMEIVRKSIFLELGKKGAAAEEND